MAISTPRCAPPATTRRRPTRRPRKRTTTRGNQRWRANKHYPFSGLLFCGRCGRKMIARTNRQKDRRAQPSYSYQSYVCATYKEYGPPVCGHNIVGAERVLRWAVYKLKETYLGPGREILIEKINAKLHAGTKRKDTGGERLERRARDLDRQIARLVAAIRTMDVPELVQELRDAKGERKELQARLDTARKSDGEKRPQTDAQRIADQLRKLRGLTAKDPAILREVLHRFIARIECHWAVKPGRYQRCPLQRVVVQLRKAAQPLTATACVMPALPDALSGLVVFELAADVEPADCADALADLLIGTLE